MKKKLDRSEYGGNHRDFLADMHLIFQNAMTYNLKVAPNSTPGDLAVSIFCCSFRIRMASSADGWPPDLACRRDRHGLGHKPDFFLVFHTSPA